MKSRFNIIIACSLLFFSCAEDEDLSFETNECKVQPAFYSKVGLNPQRTGISTAEKNKLGVVLVDFSTDPPKYYQDSSWQMGGWMGPLSLDAFGNTFLASVPKINILDNPPEAQNIIYRIDAQTGKMENFIDLPPLKKSNEQNPFGILGMAYMCSNNVLYVASVMGSDRANERGIIYAIDLASKKVIDKIENIDAIGLGISFVTGKRQLYIGKARKPELYSVKLNADGTFNGDLHFEKSLSGFGARGDDKIRKISFSKAGVMELHLLEFNFNLIAPTEKQESKATLIYNNSEEVWNLQVN